MAQLIQRHGTDPNVEPLLWVTGSTDDYRPHPLLSLCIDNLTDNSLPSIWAVDGDGDYSPVVLPMWETPGLQLAIMRALIDNGADVNGGESSQSPIRVAIASCNREAFDLLMGQPGTHPFTALTTRSHDICRNVYLSVPGIQLRGREVMQLPRTLPTDQPTEAHEAILLSFYRQLIQRDSTLATEREPDGRNVLRWTAMTDPVWPQQFIEKYIDPLVANGADITATDNMGATPLHHAACCGSPCVAASLCRRLTPTDINRGGRMTPPTRPSPSLPDGSIRTHGACVTIPRSRPRGNGRPSGSPSSPHHPCAPPGGR